MFPLSLSILAAIAITPVTSVLQRDPNYLYATFRATNQLKTSETDTLDIYSSTNGVNFSTYHVPASVPSSQGKNPSLIRDPSITHFNGKYYVAHTTGWTGNNFNIMTSDDLKTWTDYTTVSFNESNFDVGYAVGAVWAPEFFWDPGHNQTNLSIIVSIRQACPLVGFAQACVSHFPWKPYILQSTSDSNDDEAMKNWGSPTKIALTDAKSGANHIDPFPFYVEDSESDKPFHLLLKNEKSKEIEHWAAESIGGPYDMVDVLGGFEHVEGPAITRTLDGSWILYMDHYDGHYYYSESDDLKTWSTMQPLPDGMSTVARHGTVFLQMLDQPAVEGPKVPKIGNFTNIKVLAPATKTAA